jgi:protein gp37
MGKNTEIAWATHTFSPFWGCSKVSEACHFCYAETWAKRTGFKIWGQDTPRRFFGEKHWSQPLRWNKAANKLGVMHSVFCGSMCDIFEDRMDLDEHRIRVFRMVPETPNLLWLFLTKRPLKAVQMLPREWQGNGKWPRNVMVGTTIENQKRLDERMPIIELLHRQYPGVQVFASCEPLLSSLSWTRPENRYSPEPLNRNAWLAYLDWVVGGGESGHNARPYHPDWARKLRDDCANRDDMCRPWPLPFLWKQNGQWRPRQPGDPDNGTMIRLTSRGNNGTDLQHASDGGDVWMQKFTDKKKAGRLIDGREHLQFPRLSYGPQLPEVAIEQPSLS